MLCHVHVDMISSWLPTWLFATIFLLFTSLAKEPFDHSTTMLISFTIHVTRMWSSAGERRAGVIVPMCSHLKFHIQRWSVVFHAQNWVIELLSWHASGVCWVPLARQVARWFCFLSLLRGFLQEQKRRWAQASARSRRRQISDFAFRRSLFFKVWTSRMEFIDGIFMG